MYDELRYNTRQAAAHLRMARNVLGVHPGGDGEDAAGLDPEAFVSGGVPSGGTAFAGNVGVEVYGPRETRALEVTTSEF